MYTKELIKEKLHEKQYFIDKGTIGKFIKDWKIDPIYEDEQGEEYFDDIALEKMFKGLEFKTKGESDIRIAYELHKDEIQIEEKKKTELAVNNTLKPEIHREEALEGVELKKISLDITTQTVSFLADSIAQKITTDITDHIKDTDFVKSAMNMGSIKRDNEMMAKQINKLMDDNKNLAQQVESLEEELGSFKNVFSNWYIKS